MKGREEERDKRKTEQDLGNYCSRAISAYPRRGSGCPGHKHENSLWAPFSRHLSKARELLRLDRLDRHTNSWNLGIITLLSIEEPVRTQQGAHLHPLPLRRLFHVICVPSQPQDFLTCSHFRQMTLSLVLTMRKYIGVKENVHMLPWCHLQLRASGPKRSA